ncbi:DegV family protein [Clostridium perfringens]|uniref:DegV family protein n=1 Tax=Clostridium perfringens TaxID=1502 RepID=UPI001A2EEF73|nr:DegV family protein [Clostridium perfringens]EHK2440994.1 DegV family protein [Clostridium perfringens]HAT4340271.1 DegV family protein [Clostridium perfringens]HAT4346700.1 DegV family protein [Clostridium perfringens]HAT4364450.1 DegV family protein [Clostridium perfringens]
MNKIKIITDSTCDLSKEIIEKYDIDVMPMLINFGEESYLDGVEIKVDSMMERIEREDALPTTAQIVPTRFIEKYKGYLEEGYKVISIHISSNMSGTYQSACLAKAELESDDIVVIDSRNVTVGLGLIVLKAARLIEAGITLEDLEKEILEYRNHIKSTIAFESLDNLVRGGRLSKGKALFVNALGIKLMLNVLEGEMNVQGKIRGTKKMVKAMIEQFDSIPKKEGEPIILVELENEDIYLPIKEYLENNNIEYLKLPLGCSVAIHSGPKVCALFYVEEY